MDWQAFFAMGGYAVFVWPSYGIALITLLGVAVWSQLRHREAVHGAREEQGDDTGTP